MHAAFMKVAVVNKFNRLIWIEGRKGKQFVGSGFYFTVIRQGGVLLQILKSGEIQFEYIIAECMIVC
jgi:predicted nucleic acid-binding Zn ribbon protein